MSKQATTKATEINKFDETITVEVGDVVSFKCDTEQAGEIVAIKQRSGSTVLVLLNGYGFDGEYIGGQTETEVDLYDCWID